MLQLLCPRGLAHRRETVSQLRLLGGVGGVLQAPYLLLRTLPIPPRSHPRLFTLFTPFTLFAPLFFPSQLVNNRADFQSTSHPAFSSAGCDGFPTSAIFSPFTACFPFRHPAAQDRPKNNFRIWLRMKHGLNKTIRKSIRVSSVFHPWPISSLAAGNGFPARRSFLRSPCGSAGHTITKTQIAKEPRRRRAARALSDHKYTISFRICQALFLATPRELLRGEGRPGDAERRVRGTRVKYGDCPDFCGRTPQKWDCPLPTHARTSACPAPAAAYFRTLVLRTRVPPVSAVTVPRGDGKEYIEDLACRGNTACPG